MDSSKLESKEYDFENIFNDDENNQFAENNEYAENDEYSEDDEIVLEHEDFESRKNRDKKEYPFAVLSVEQVGQHMEKSIVEIVNILQLPPTTSRMLLNHFDWDKYQLLDNYYDCDQEKLFKEVGLVNPSLMRNPIVLSSDGVKICEICCMEKPLTVMHDIGCGHLFCDQCWSDYLTFKIVECGMGQTISCAASNCSIFVDDESVMKFVQDLSVKIKYQQQVINGFVQRNRLMRWCSSADCTYAIRVERLDWRPVTCVCKHTFCFQCGNHWHGPVKCEWLEKWFMKLSKDLATANWLADNTKPCPKCKAPIQKMGGCNHMFCLNKNCGTDFCWLCLRKWVDHHPGGACNVYVDKEKDKTTVSQNQSLSALKRYLFYSQRYKNHMLSFKFEEKLYASVKRKMEEMQDRDRSWVDVQFLNKAVNTLCDCRQTLMYSYVFAYYLKVTNYTVLFEENQRRLECATETLSEYLERDMTVENLDNIKAKVLDGYLYCDGRREKLLDFVDEGYDNGWWLFHEENF